MLYIILLRQYIYNPHFSITKTPNGFPYPYLPGRRKYPALLCQIMDHWEYEPIPTTANPIYVKIYGEDIICNFCRYLLPLLYMLPKYIDTQIQFLYTSIFHTYVADRFLKIPWDVIQDISMNQMFFQK